MIKQFLVTVLAVALTLGAYEWYQRHEREKYISKAYIAQGLALASGLKTRIAAYYQDMGELPASNAALGLPEPDAFANGSIARVTIGKGGAITIQYNEKAGVKDGVLILSPDVGRPHLGIVWTCQTPSFKDIAVTMPMCEYRADAA